MHLYWVYIFMKVENVTPAELGHGYGNGYPLDVLGRWLRKLKDIDL